MKQSFGPAAIMVAAIALPLAACSNEAPANEAAASSETSAKASKLLPRSAIVPLSMVTEYFPGIDTEASVEPNQTSVGNAAASISVVFTDAAGTKKVTLSVDEYPTAGDGAAAFATAVAGSKAAPGFKPAPPPNLGEEALAGTSQVGEEQHFGLGAREGRLIVSATHAGGIPVTPENSSKLIELGRAELATAKQAVGP